MTTADAATTPSRPQDAGTARRGGVVVGVAHEFRGHDHHIDHDVLVHPQQEAANLRPHVRERQHPLR